MKMKYLIISLTALIVISSCYNPQKPQVKSQISMGSHVHDCQHHTFKILKDVIKVNLVGGEYMVNDKYLLSVDSIPENLNKFYSDSNSKDSIEFYLTKKYIDGSYRDVFNQLDELLKKYRNAGYLQILTKGDRSCYKGTVVLNNTEKALDQQGNEYELLIMPSHYHKPNQIVVDTTEYYILEGTNLDNLELQLKTCREMKGFFSLGLDTSFTYLPLKLKQNNASITASKNIRCTCDL